MRIPALAKMFVAIDSRMLCGRSAETMRNIIVRIRAILKPNNRRERINLTWCFRLLRWNKLILVTAEAMYIARKTEQMGMSGIAVGLPPTAAKRDA